jgi:hypothetical protein
MNLKGNIQIEQGKPEVEVTESMTQIMVSIDYSLSGVDLSEGVIPTGEEEGDAEEASRVMDLAQKEIRKFFIDFYRGLELPPGADPITGAKEFIGLDCDVNFYGGETIEELKNMSVDVAVSAYYDIPRSALESTIELAVNSLIGKQT